jgi:hypothetical protein
MSRQQLKLSKVLNRCGIRIFYCELLRFAEIFCDNFYNPLLKPISETNTIHAGLLVEVWTKGMIIDRALGFQFITLDSLPYNQYNYPATYEQWYNIDADVVMVNGEVGGTRDPTGHMLLLDLHFEMPFGESKKKIKKKNFFNKFN